MTSTPAARVERAKKLLVEAIDELIEARLARGADNDWIDQNASPLGKRRHLELVRTGKLPGAREGRRVLVRRSDLDKYLASKGSRVVVTSDEDVEGMMQLIAGGKR